MMSIYYDIGWVNDLHKSHDRRNEEDGDDYSGDLDDDKHL